MNVFEMVHFVVVVVFVVCFFFILSLGFLFTFRWAFMKYLLNILVNFDDPALIRLSSNALIFGNKLANSFNNSSKVKPATIAHSPLAPPRAHSSSTCYARDDTFIIDEYFLAIE